MRFIFNSLFLLVAFESLAFGWIPLHNGRELSAEQNDTSPSSYATSARPSAPRDGLVRPSRRRDAAVFRLEFLHGTDKGAFEFVNPDSGWRDLSPAKPSNPADYYHYGGYGDYADEYFLRLAGTTQSPLTPMVPEGAVSRKLSVKSNREKIFSTVPLPGHSMESADNVTNSSFFNSSTPTTLTRQTALINSTAKRLVMCNSSATTKGPTTLGTTVDPCLPANVSSRANETTQVANVTRLTTRQHRDNATDGQRTNTTTTYYSTFTTRNFTTQAPTSIFNETVTFRTTVAEENVTSSLEPNLTARTTAEVSTPETLSTAEPSSTTVETTSLQVTTDNYSSTENTSSTTPILELFKSTVAVTSDFFKSTVTMTSELFKSTVAPTTVETTETATSTFAHPTTTASSTITSTMPTTSTTTSTTTTPSTTAPSTTTMHTTTIAAATTTATTTKTDTSTPTPTTNTTTATTTTTAAIESETTNFNYETTFVFETSPSTVSTTLLEVLMTTTPATTVITEVEVKNVTLGQDNVTVIPFNNFNVATVRMSVHVTSIFSRKQLEELLQQGLQNAFVSALSRNSHRYDSSLIELKRIVRMANPAIEVLGFSDQKSSPTASVTHLNVVFGAFVSPNRDGTKYSNRTFKAHLKKDTLQGQHIRDIMLSVEPIELSAAAGIPIEEIRPVNYQDEDIIVGKWFSNSTEDELAEEDQTPSKEAVDDEKMPEWVLPLVIVTAALVLLFVYFVVTGMCVLKGYRLKLEKVGTVGAKSPEGTGSYAEGAARLAEVVASPNHQLASSSGSNFTVQPLAPVSQMILPTESTSPKSKQQLELRRWSVNGRPDEKLVKATQPTEGKKAGESGDTMCDRSVNTSTVMLQNTGTATEGPEVVNRATSAIHRQNRTVGTSSTQFQTDQSTDTTVDIGHKAKGIQTTLQDSTTTPDSACSMGVAINGERIARHSVRLSSKDRHKRRSRRRTRERSFENGDGVGNGNETNRAYRHSKEDMANSQEAKGTSGILLHPLELRYDTIYLRQNDNGGSQVDAPFKLVKLAPGVDVKEQLLQTVQPISLQDTKAIEDRSKDSRKRSHPRSKDKQAEKKEGEQLKTLLDTVEGIVRKYTARGEPEDTKPVSEMTECLQQTMQRDISLVKAQPKVGRNMRAVSPDDSPKPAPMLASFEAALRLRVAEETVGEEHFRRQYQIPVVQQSPGNASMLARHLLEGKSIGKIGCLPDV